MVCAIRIRIISLKEVVVSSIDLSPLSASRSCDNKGADTEKFITTGYGPTALNGRESTEEQRTYALRIHAFAATCH